MLAQCTYSRIHITHTHTVRTWQRLSQNITLLYAGAYLGPNIIVIEVQLGRKLRRSANYFVETREQKATKIKVYRKLLLLLHTAVLRKSSVSSANPLYNVERSECKKCSSICRFQFAMKF